MANNVLQCSLPLFSVTLEQHACKLYQYHLNGGQILNAKSNKIKVIFKLKRKKEERKLKICKVGHPKVAKFH